MSLHFNDNKLSFVIKQDKLNGLGMLAAHKNIELNADEVIDKLAKYQKK